jgi:hypothetical protein
MVICLTDFAFTVLAIPAMLPEHDAARLGRLARRLDAERRDLQWRDLALPVGWTHRLLPVAGAA